MLPAAMRRNSMELVRTEIPLSGEHLV
jgi:hypothetical protein